MTAQEYAAAKANGGKGLGLRNGHLSTPNITMACDNDSNHNDPLLTQGSTIAGSFGEGAMLGGGLPGLYAPVDPTIFQGNQQRRGSGTSSDAGADNNGGGSGSDDQMSNIRTMLDDIAHENPEILTDKEEVEGMPTRSGLLRVFCEITSTARRTMERRHGRALAARARSSSR